MRFQVLLLPLQLSKSFSHRRSYSSEKKARTKRRTEEFLKERDDIINEKKVY